jgi:hypothetical protein
MLPRTGILDCLLLVALGVICAGCGGHQTDGPGPLDGQLVLQLKGRVAFPSALTGGAVSVAAVAESGERFPIATVQLSPSGAFSLTLDGYNPDYLLLMCSSGEGHYKDAWTGESVPLDPESPLCMATPATAGLNAQTVVLDPWSTLAFALAQAYHTHPEQFGISGTDWTSALALARERLGQHLYPDAPLDIGFTDPADPALETLYFPAPRAASGLAGAALATLAAQWPVPDGGPRPTLQGLLGALVSDIDDGRFDGVQGPGEQAVPVLLAGQALSPQLLRYQLAAAIHAQVTSGGVSFLDDWDPLPEFGARHGWYQRLSQATGPLFGPDAGPLFDPIGPTIAPLAGFPAEGGLITAATPLKLVVEATDPHGIAGLSVVAPPTYAGLVGELQSGGDRAILELPFDPEDVTSPEQHFRFAAQDQAGNETLFDVTFVVALGAPVIDQLIPPAGTCLEEAPAELLVFAGHEDFLDIQVQLLTDDATVSCESQVDGYYHCPASFFDGFQGTVRVTDPYGRETSEPWSICIDNAPPEVLFDPPDGSWYGPGWSPITVTMEDEHQVSLVAVTVNGMAAEVTPTKTTFALSLPEPPQDALALVEVTVKDIADHVTTGSAGYPYDDVPPVIEVPLLGIITGSFDYIHHAFKVTDDGSGLAKVKLIGGEGLWNLEFDEDTYILVGTVDPQPGVPPHVVVEAEDMVGNVTSEVFHVYLDTSTPSVTQLTSLVTDDHTVVPTYDEASGSVDYTGGEAMAVSFNATTCADGCPALGKYAPLLFDDGQLDGESPGVVRFKFVLSDPCPTGAIKPTLWVQPEWYTGEQLVHVPPPFPANCGGNVTVTIPLLLPLSDQDEGLFPDGLLPDRLVVTVADLGGQAAVADVAFQLEVLPPPLFVMDTPETLPNDMLTELLDSKQPKLHVVANDGGTYQRSVLVNPTSVPINLTLDALPSEFILISHTPVYVQPDDPWDAACGAGQCQYVGMAEEDQCTDPISFAADTLYAKTNQTARLRQVVDGVGTFLNLNNGFELAPGEERNLDLMTGALETDLVLDQTKTFALADDSGIKLHLATPEIAQAACRWSDAPIPSSMTSYDVPDVVTGYSVKLVNGNVSLSTSLTDVQGETGILSLPVPLQAFSYQPWKPLPTSPW